MSYTHTVGGLTFSFVDLKHMLACASPHRSGDVLAGVAAASAQERAAAQFALANTRLTDFLNEAVIPYEADEVTRLIFDTHSKAAFARISHLTVGGLRDWLLSSAVTTSLLSEVAHGLTPEMASAAVKIMRLQDLILVAQKCRVVTAFRNTIGLVGRLSTRLQPNHPTDDLRGIAASLLDGILLGCGDAVIGVNPATDSVESYIRIVEMLDDFRLRSNMPGQSCVLAHVTTAMDAMAAGAPVDIVFQSVAGSQAANRGFGIDIALLAEAHEMALSLKRGTVGDNVMYFETGQGSALSSNSHFGVDQQTIEARAYAVARKFSPLLVNTVVGFIGPEYLYNGKQITRAGLEDHCCAKLLGLPMGCDVCYTNHAEADQDDMDGLLTLLSVAGCTFVMGVPGADDIMLNYQSTSFHDALYVRKALGKRPAPEFEKWLVRLGLFSENGDRMSFGSTLSLTHPVVSALASTSSNTSAAVPWNALKKLTAARIGIEPTGVSQPTEPTLQFQWDHAMARDAVRSTLDTGKLTEELNRLGMPSATLQSMAPGRDDYLLFPTHGRRLSNESRCLLSTMQKGWDVIFVLADGLSATAVLSHAVNVLSATVTLIGDSWRIAPVMLVEQARVAVGDDVASELEAEMVVVLIGERPGLYSADSLGAYLTWRPHTATVDSERNCISNIRPGGLSTTDAAHKLHYLMATSRRRQISGVALKDEAVIHVSAEPVPDLLVHNASSTSDTVAPAAQIPG